MDRKKILIVEDEPDTRATIKDRLEFEEYEVIAAPDGETGIMKARREKPDLIILDILLLGMNGKQVATALRQDQSTRDIPIIFVSCLYSKEDEKDRRHKTEGQIFLSKPFNFDELLEAIKKRME